MKRTLTITCAVLGLLVASACAPSGGRRSSKSDASSSTGSDVTSGQDATDSADGTPGSEGTDGADGLPGTEGVEGTPGTEGQDGTDGAEGVEGVEGIPGTDAQDGSDGAEGVEGTPGTDAQDGTDAAEGVDGTDSADATDGTDSNDGAPGCTTSTDKQTLNQPSAFDTVFACANECTGQPDCVKSCAGGALKLTDNCAHCVGQLAGCAAESCFETCTQGDTATCYSCVSEVCSGSWSQCAQIPLPEPGDTPDCTTNQDCGPNMQCQGGECVPATPPPAGCGNVTFEGCCDGDTLKYCENEQVTSGPCDPGTCGWDTSSNFYNCNTSGGADPSGQNPKACP